MCSISKLKEKPFRRLFCIISSAFWCNIYPTTPGSVLTGRGPPSHALSEPPPPLALLNAAADSSLGFLLPFIVSLALARSVYPILMTVPWTEWMLRRLKSHWGQIVQGSFSRLLRSALAMQRYKLSCPPQVRASGVGLAFLPWWRVLASTPTGSLPEHELSSSWSSDWLVDSREAAALL